jgi:hypothetical protein
MCFGTGKPTFLTCQCYPQLIVESAGEVSQNNNLLASNSLAIAMSSESEKLIPASKKSLTEPLMTE